MYVRMNMCKIVYFTPYITKLKKGDLYIIALISAHYSFIRDYVMNIQSLLPVRNEFMTSLWVLGLMEALPGNLLEHT